MDGPQEFDDVVLDLSSASEPSCRGAAIEGKVLAIVGLTLAVDAVDRATTVRLPEAVNHVYLTYQRRGQLHALRGRLLTTDVVGELRFVVNHPVVRRLATRISLSLPVDVIGDDDCRTACQTVDVSADGALLEACLKVDVGATMRLDLWLPDLDEPFATSGTVVRVDENERFAVQFESSATELRRQLGLLTAAHNRALLRRQARASSDAAMIDPDF